MADLGDMETAAKCFLKVVDEDTENTDAFARLGMTLATQHEYEGATQFLEHAINLGNSDIDTLTNLAFVYFRLGHLAEAAKTISAAREKNNADPQITRLLRRIQWAVFTENIRHFISSSRLLQNTKLLLTKYKCRLRTALTTRRKP